MHKFSSIHKISSKKWLIKESKNYIKIASFYDRLNNFDESDQIYAKALSMIKLAQEQEDEEPDNEYHAEEVDPNLLDPNVNTYEQFKSKFSQPGYDKTSIWRGEAMGLDPGPKYTRGINDTDYRNVFEYYESSLGSQVDVINAFIEALSKGGSNVLLSLQSLSPLYIELSKEMYDNYFLNSLNTALAHYYRNPLFVKFKDVIGGTLYDVFKYNLSSGQIDATTVKIIEDINKQKQLRAQNYNIHVNTIKRILSEANIPLDNDVVAYFYRLFYLSKYDEEIILPKVQKFQYDKFRFAKSIISSDSDKFADVFKIVEYLGIDPVKKYMEIHNISEFTGYHFNALVKFKNNTGAYFDEENVFEKSLIIPYIKQITGSLLDVFTRKTTNLSYMDFVAMKSAFTPEEFVEKVKDGVIKLNGDNTQNNIFYASSLQLLSKLSEEDIQYLETNIRSFDKQRDILIIKIYLDRGKEVVPFIQNNSQRFKFIALHSSQDQDRINKPPLFDVGLYYDYCVKFEQEMNSFISPCKELNKVYSFIGARILDFSPKEIMVMANTRYDNGNAIPDIFTVTPEMIEQSRGKADIDFIYHNTRFSYELGVDKSQTDEAQKELSQWAGVNWDLRSINYMLFSLGKVDPDWLFTCNSLAGNYDFVPKFKEIVDKGYLLGDIDEMLRKTSTGDIHKDSLWSIDTDLSLVDFTNKYNMVKESIARTPAYQNIKPGSFEYEKLFLMIYLNWEARNRNATVWSNLFDDVINSNISESSQYRHFKKASNYYGSDLRNFTPAKSKDFEQINSSIKSLIKNFYFLNYDNLIHQLKVFEKLSDLSKENVLKFLEKDPYFGRVISVNSVLIDNLDNFNEITNKFTDYYIKNYINLPLDMSISTFKNNYLDKFLEENKLSDEEVESILRKLVGGHVSKNQNILYPKYAQIQILSRITDLENLKNASLILQIFNKLTNDVLNSFANKKFGSSYTNLDVEQKKTVIHDLSNILPSNTNQNFVGFAKYFIENYNQSNKIDVKLIGNNWSSPIKLFDKERNLIGDNYLVRNLVSLVDENGNKVYTVESLAKAIKISSISEIFEDLEDPNDVFLDEFTNHFGAGSDTKYSKEDKILLYSSLEKNYLQGIQTPLPEWASFDKTVQKDSKTQIRLRFLPRNDPRGMFLGIYAECCQHPTSYAATCALDGQSNPNSAFMVFEINGQLAGEGYVWTVLNKDGDLVIDSLETIGGELFHSPKNKQIVKRLLIEFSASLGDRMLTMGKGPINFEEFEEYEDPETNSDESVIENYKKYLQKFHPYGETDMYSDAEEQRIVPKEL